MLTNGDMSGNTALKTAIASFRRGDPVLIHDFNDREGEIDLVVPAHAVTADSVARLRNDAGGLVCVALSADVCDAFSLPFARDAIDHPTTEGYALSYDDRSSFSLTVNHRETATGITDRDRARTITALADAAESPAETDFPATFRAPGHVHLLRAGRSLAERQGHTELAIALATEADIPPAVVVCEMLDDHSGEALSPEQARAYADRTDRSYLEGTTILESLGPNRSE